MTTFSTLFRDFDAYFQYPVAQRAVQPAGSVSEHEDHYLVTFDVPGVAKDDIDLEFEKNVLTVRAERKDGRPLTLERAVSLPQGLTAEDIRATHDNGVLAIKVPKPKAAQRTKIKVGDASPRAPEQLVS